MIDIAIKILPGTGRWQAPKATDGGGPVQPPEACRGPSTTAPSAAVPLPVPGRNL